MKRNQKGMYSLLIAGVLLAGCEKQNLYKGDENSGGTPGEVFDFSTTQLTQLNLSYEVPEGFEVYFEAYTENPLAVDEYKNYVKKEGVKPFLQGYTDKNGNCQLPVVLPSYATEMYVCSSMAGVPALLSGKISDQMELQEITIESQKLSKADAKKYYSNWATQANLVWTSYMTSDKHGRPDVIEKMELTDRTMEVINATIPKGANLNLSFAGVTEVEISKQAEVRMYYVSDGSVRKNALAYYTFTGEQPSQEYINKHLILLFPNLSAEALERGDGVQLKYRENETAEWQDEFPAGTKIGFVLLVDAWKNGEVKDKDIHVMYSNNKYNSYNIVSIMADRPQMAMFKAEENVILSFEDQPWTENPKLPYPGDFRDNIFVIHANPKEALPDINEGQKPEDPKGTLVYLTQGVLAFEDVWPYKGDYDMNDVVLKYSSGLYGHLIEGEVYAITDTFVFLHSGAAYQNAFGYQLPVATDNIDKVELVSDYQCDGQGQDRSLDQATIMLFDDGKNVPLGTTFYVRTWFKQPVDYFDLYKMSSPYNPFIVVNGFLENNRKEVHLVNYAPTAKADLGLLHYGHDLSVPAKGIYYVSDANYPFAINIAGAESYTVPTESSKIEEFYPHFMGWVNSGGKDYKDWYLPAGN